MIKTKVNDQINKIPLFNSNGKKIDTIELNKDIFNGKFNEALLYQAVVMYRANQRRGTASTKTRGDVRGGGKKPWRQKGTGRARVGSIRSPIWRGGGIAFGPHPRDFRYDLPKKIKNKAFISSLNAKLKDGQCLAVEDFSLGEPKTKRVSELLKGLNVKQGEKILFLVDKVDQNFALASRNIKNLTLKKVQDATAFDVLSNERIAITKGATESLNKEIRR